MAVTYTDNGGYGKWRDCYKIPVVADSGGYGPRPLQAATVTDSDGYGKQTEAVTGQQRLRDSDGYGW